MIRLVLAVALAAALLATAAPALDAARTARTERLVAGDLDRIEAAAAELAREESPAEPGEPGPCRALTLSLPTGSPTAAPVDYVALGGRPDHDGSANADARDRDVIASKIDGGRRRVRRVGVELRAADRTDGEWRVAPDARPLVLGGGTHRLVLRLVRLDGRPTVLVSGPTFKTESATTPAHASTAGPTPRHRRGRPVRVRPHRRA